MIYLAMGQDKLLFPILVRNSAGIRRLLRTQLSLRSFKKSKNVSTNRKIKRRLVISWLFRIILPPYHVFKSFRHQLEQLATWLLTICRHNLSLLLQVNSWYQACCLLDSHQLKIISRGELIKQICNLEIIRQLPELLWIDFIKYFQPWTLYTLSTVHSKIGFFKRLFTSLCLLHVQITKAFRDERSGGFFFRSSVKCFLHFGQPNEYANAQIVRSI